MKRTVVFFLIGAAAGAATLGLTYFRPVNAQLELAAEQGTTIDSLHAEIASLRARLTDARSEITALESALADTTPPPADDAAPTNPQDQPPITNLADLVQEARPLLQRMAPVLEQMRKQGQDQWIATEVAKWQKALGLSDDQTAEITTLITERADAFAAEDKARLMDDSVPVGQLFPDRETWERRALALDEVMAQTLSADQFESYRTEQLTSRAENITGSANRRVERLSETLDLNPVQQDQMFEILVRKSPSYDPAMQIETATDDAVAPSLGPDVTEEEAVRRILNPDQLPAYESYLEQRQQRRSNPFGLPGR